MNAISTILRDTVSRNTRLKKFAITQNLPRFERTLIQMANKKKSTARIPKFKTYEEEALFWDTHSSEDFPEEFKPVQVRFRRPLRIRLAVPLEQPMVRQLENIGKERGIEPIALARQWIIEHLAPTQP